MAQFLRKLLVEITHVSSREIQRQKYVAAYRMADYDDILKVKKYEALKQIYDEFLEVAKTETTYVIDNLIDNQSGCKSSSETICGIAAGEKYMRK